MFVQCSNETVNYSACWAANVAGVPTIQKFSDFEVFEGVGIQSGVIIHCSRLFEILIVRILAKIISYYADLLESSDISCRKLHSHLYIFINNITVLMACKFHLLNHCAKFEGICRSANSETMQVI